MELVLTMWTVYDHPSDYPDSYVARQWGIGEKCLVATGSVVALADLDQLREWLQWDLGLMVVPRSPEDDPTIVETWL